MDRPIEGAARSEDGPQTRSSSAARSLNLPVGMSRDALHLDTIARRSWQGLASPMKHGVCTTTSSPTRTSYSDRFIPSRSSSNLTGFALLDRSPSGANISQANDTREEGGAAYSMLLRTELFGQEAGSPATPENRTGISARDPMRSPISPTVSRNLFRFKSDPKPSTGSKARPERPYDISPAGIDSSLAGTPMSPRKAPRKIARSPYKLWDAAKCRIVRTMGGHRTRVGALAWNSHILSSGSRDRNILQRDVRVPDDFVSKLVGHKSEVCGLKWSYDDRELASGGNDNQLLVWNRQSTQPVVKFSEHGAAVKAIAWSPHQHGLLASGGGTADRCIRFWNTATSTALNCYDTGSQVCNLVWSKNVNEIVSTHGYSQNQIIVWRYPTMSKLTTLTGHTMRVLYLAISPDGQTIVTGAGDETLRFWNVFPSPKSQSVVRDNEVWSLGRTYIR